MTSDNRQPAQPPSAPQFAMPGRPAIPASPLAIIDPSELDRLFSKPPLELTDEELTTMVNHYRAQRSKWVAEEAAPKVPRRPKAGTPEAATVKAELSKLTLEDLL